MKKLLSISNSIFVIAIFIFFYGLYKIYITKQSLPIGTCPIYNNRIILYLGVFFMILSIVVSYIEDGIEKRKLLNR